MFLLLVIFITGFLVTFVGLFILRNIRVVAVGLAVLFAMSLFNLWGAIGAVDTMIRSVAGFMWATIVDHPFLSLAVWLIVFFGGLAGAAALSSKVDWDSLVERFNADRA